MDGYSTSYKWLTSSLSHWCTSAPWSNKDFSIDLWPRSAANVRGDLVVCNQEMYVAPLHNYLLSLILIIIAAPGSHYIKGSGSTRIIGHEHAYTVCRMGFDWMAKWWCFAHITIKELHCIAQCNFCHNLLLLSNRKAIHNHSDWFKLEECHFYQESRNKA